MGIRLIVLSIVLLLFSKMHVDGQIVIYNNDTMNFCNDSLLLKLGDLRGEIQWQYTPDSIEWRDIQNETRKEIWLKNNLNFGLYRARIDENSCFPVYSDTVSIQSTICLNGASPILGQLEINSITNASVGYIVTITNDGGLGISSKGIIWNTNPFPTIEDNLGYFENGSGVEDFAGEINKLDSGKTYYIRAYAINDIGISYSDEIILTTYLNANSCDESESCCNLLYSQIAIDNLDLSNSKYKLIYDLLLEIDPGNALHTFSRLPYDFLMWCEMISPTDILDFVTLDGTYHETTHQVNSQLSQCNPFLYVKYLFLGNVYKMDFNRTETKHISIVEETIPDDLKDAERYQHYILDSKSYNNNFKSLLDELNSYTGGAWFVYRYLDAGKYSNSEWPIVQSDGELGGMVNFMAFLQCYLKALRSNYNDSYIVLKNQENTLEYIQILWNKAEEILNLCYPYSVESQTNSNYQMIINLKYLKRIYSDDLLMELDLIGIEHKIYSDWSATYLKGN